MGIARAIDVGYGNTKYTTDDYEENFKSAKFPSIAPMPSANEKQFNAGGVLENINTVTIEINNTRFAVGPGARNQAAATTQRVLDEEYCVSDVYQALVCGALYFMKQPEIDMLVLGLPLTTFRTHREKLRERIVGGHTIPSPWAKQNPASPKMSVQVKNVRVLPQPMGAFFNYCIPRGLFDEMNDQTNLILDVGHGTFDWFLANGSMPVPSRCGGYAGGVSKIIAAVADAMGINKNVLNVNERIDTALRTGQVIKIDGKPVDVKKDYENTAGAAIRDSINVMLGSVGVFSDVDNILLTGGGADLFYPHIEKAMPGRVIIKDEEPMFSNVHGFQIVGEQWLASLERNNG